MFDDEWVNELCFVFVVFEVVMFFFFVFVGWLGVLLMGVVVGLGGWFEGLVVKYDERGWIVWSKWCFFSDCVFWSVGFFDVFLLGFLIGVDMGWLFCVGVYWWMRMIMLLVMILSIIVSLCFYLILLYWYLL